MKYKLLTSNPLVALCLSVFYSLTLISSKFRAKGRIVDSESQQFFLDEVSVT